MRGRRVPHVPGLLGAVHHLPAHVCDSSADRGELAELFSVHHNVLHGNREHGHHSAHTGTGQQAVHSAHQQAGAETEKPLESWTE